MNIDRDSDAVIKQYAKLARDYDSRWSSYVRATSEATIKRLPWSVGSILDVGCGTGALLSQLVGKFPDSNIAGVDASSEMLELARSRLPPNVTLDRCWAEALPFDDASFDTIVSCNMFHFIRRPEAALDEMLRVLRPNGTIVITDWCNDYLSCKLCDFYLRWFDPAHFEMYGVSKCRELLEAANACQVTVDKFKITWLWGLMTATARKCSDPYAVDIVTPLECAT